MMIALLESLSGKLGTIEICPNGHNRQGLVKFRSLCERRAQGVGGRNWKAVEGGRCPLLLHNWFPLEKQSFTFTTCHHHPFEDETQSFQLYMAPMHGKGDDGDVCDKIDVGAFDIGLEIFSKLSVET